MKTSAPTRRAPVRPVQCPPPAVRFVGLGHRVGGGTCGPNTLLPPSLTRRERPRARARVGFGGASRLGGRARRDKHRNTGTTPPSPTGRPVGSRITPAPPPHPPKIPPRAMSSPPGQVRVARERFVTTSETELNPILRAPPRPRVPGPESESERTASLLTHDQQPAVRMRQKTRPDRVGLLIGPCVLRSASSSHQARN